MSSVRMRLKVRRQDRPRSRPIRFLPRGISDGHLPKHDTVVEVVRNRFKNKIKF